jgi:hypothetical protein
VEYGTDQEERLRWEAVERSGRWRAAGRVCCRDRAIRPR